MKNFARSLWTLTGRLGFLVAQYPIGLIVRNSRRTRVLITCGNEYLVVKHWLGDDRWMLPGGGLHRNEDPLLAAQREVKEEIGLELPTATFQNAGQFKCRDGAFKFDYDLYVVQLPEKPKLQLQRIEILSSSWFNKDDMPPPKACPELAVALRHWP